MKRAIPFLSLLILLAGCSGQRQIIVWDGSKLIGLGIFLLIALIIGIVFLRAWILDKIADYKRKRNKKFKS